MTGALEQARCTRCERSNDGREFTPSEATFDFPLKGRLRMNYFTSLGWMFN
jgi:hypothetical protein